MLLMSTLVSPGQGISTFYYHNPLVTDLDQLMPLNAKKKTLVTKSVSQGLIAPCFALEISDPDAQTLVTKSQALNIRFL